jgi:hypothetical protein
MHARTSADMIFVASNHADGLELVTLEEKDVSELKVSKKPPQLNIKPCMILQ